MRTMADAMAADERRRNRPQPIYGDPNLGYYEGDFGSSESDFVHHAPVTEWPAGYWPKYEELRAEAKKVSQALALHVVVGLNGRYHVYALMPVGIGKSGPTRGPEANDRNAAWEAFIGTFKAKPISPVVPRQPRLAVKLDDKMNHDAWAQKAAPAFDKPISETTIHTPKGRKARKP